MRRCKRCRVDKPLTDFYEIRYQTKEGEARCRQHTCSACCVKAAVKNRRQQWEGKYKKYSRDYYTSEVAQGRQKACRDRLRDLVNATKRRPCADCGKKFPPVCMDYDHRDPSLKVQSVTQLVAKRHRWEVIQAEIAKCDLVCACCHRLRTAKMLGW